MQSIARRVAILGFARLAQQALGFLSPIFMVRLFSVEQYGEYRDFLLYGTILVSVVQFSINSSLAYFIPKDPARERLYFTQASFFSLCTSSAAVVLVLLFSDYFPSAIARTYQYALCLYVFFISNIDAWEVFWIAKKQTVNVLYYSICRLGVRMVVVVATAYVTRRVDWVIWSLVGFEALRLLVMGSHAARKKLLIARFDTAALKAQLAFFGPIGVFQIFLTVNTFMGQFFISAVLGPAVLAVYTIGTYLYPIIHLIRGSIGEVIMPEIVSRKNEPPKIALILWQRATVIYCAVMFPLAVLLFYYADVIVQTLFTSAYADAIPIFQIFVFLLVRECFDFGTPLRVVNRTKVFLAGGVLMLVVNLALILVLFEQFGVLAPVLAMIISRILLGIYLGIYVIKYCEFSLSDMLPWSDIAKTAVLCLAGIPILYAGEWLPIGSLIRAILFGAMYTAAFIGLLSKSGIPEITDFIARAWARTGFSSIYR